MPNWETYNGLVFRHGRKKVTAVHKANIMKLGDGLFLRSCEEVAELYPTIEFEKMIVDNTTMQARKIDLLPKFSHGPIS